MGGFAFVSFLSLVVLVQIVHGAQKSEEEPLQEPEVSRKSEASSENDATQASESESPTNAATESAKEEDKNYALGSLCNYCSYCKV